MNDFFKRLSGLGIIPVIKLNDESKALPLARALLKGNLPVAEVTFRTDAAPIAIKAISKEYPELLVGAGTVLTIKQAEAAIDAGACFIVSPGFNKKVVEFCTNAKIPVIPGCSTATEIENALEMGLNVVKFFPASSIGGISAIRALSAAYTDVCFVPTGGINENNLNEYLSCYKVLACGGSWMVKPNLIDEDNFDEITTLTKNAVKTMLGFRLAHIGINNVNENEAEKTASLFNDIFGFEKENSPVSIWLNDIEPHTLEIMKNSKRGKNGHIAISTNSIERAISYFRRRGIELDTDSVLYTDETKKKIKLIYFKDSFAGFDVHLCL